MTLTGRTVDIANESVPFRLKFSRSPTLTQKVASCLWSLNKMSGMSPLLQIKKGSRGEKSSPTRLPQPKAGAETPVKRLG